MMSDDDRDIDIESDDGDDSDSRQARSISGNQYFSQADKRAHHNALERKRRDHIKDSFTSLRDSVPALQGEKVSQNAGKNLHVNASRAQILKKAAEYIQFMRRKNNSHQQDIDDLKRQNSILEAQIRTLERAKATGNFAADSSDIVNSNIKSEDSSQESESSDEEIISSGRNTMNGRLKKKIKTNGYSLA